MTTKIASIYFAPVKAVRNYGGGPYRMPAVALTAEPFILTIKDVTEIDRGPYGEGGNRRSIIKRVDATRGEVIARCLVNEWAYSGLGMNPQCHPGIWVVREMLPENNADGTPILDADGAPQWREASIEERAAMWEQDLSENRAADQAYARMRFQEDNALVVEKPGLARFKMLGVTPLGAKQYGMEADWLTSGNSIATKVCQYCTSSINAAAIRCPRPTCGEIVDVQAYAKQQAIQKLALDAAMKAERANQAA